MPRTALLMLLAGSGAVVVANDNGLARTPPMGWRSWNLYGGNVNQSLMESIMDGLVVKRNGTSLRDIGYTNAGLDDNWQACGSPAAAPGMHYHDADGNPLVNTATFPDMKAMTSHAHALNLTVGWYGNNCICRDHCRDHDECQKQMKGDVAAFIKYGYDSWKLDGCGGEWNLVDFNKHIQDAGVHALVENCHWGIIPPAIPDPDLPPAEGCPWNFYRSSVDVRASYASILYNLGTVMPLHKRNLSYPGCWAYPDMLQVGCQHGPGGAADPGLTPEETRTHFGAWAIVSSPLTLSHDVNNETVSAQIWDVITNIEVIAVNQAYFGDSGGRFAESDAQLEFTDAFIERSNGAERRVAAPEWQLLYKPVGGGKVAVLAMNSATDEQSLNVEFASVPGLTCASCPVRDLWARADLGPHQGNVSVSVAGHDAAFLVIG